MFFEYNAEEARWKAQLKVYNNTRSYLLLYALLSLLSTILLWASEGLSSILISAYLPYYFVIRGMYECGMLDAAYYPANVRVFAGSGVFVVYLLSALIVIALFLLCWWQTRGKAARGWMIFAAVLLVTDTIVLVFAGDLFSVAGLLDLVIHGALLYQVYLGERAACTLSHPPAWTKGLLPDDLQGGANA